MNSEQKNVSLESRDLYNTGGPSSRTRTENISSSIFYSKKSKSKSDRYYFVLPANTFDHEELLIKIANKFGWHNFNDALKELKLPKERLLVIPSKSNSNDRKNTYSKLNLKNALILSKCNQNFYNPDSQMIFTEKRLTRVVELIKVNLESYYGMD